MKSLHIASDTVAGGLHFRAMAVEQRRSLCREARHDFLPSEVG
jgi:hypothetical protein